MSYKLATYISLLLIIGVGILFFGMSFNLSSSLSQYVGPGTFPQIISFLVIIFGVISFFSTIKEKDQRIELPNFRVVVFTVVMILLFITAWQFVGAFYVIAFIFSFTLLYVYNQSRHSWKKVLISSFISLILSGLVYVIFELLLSMSF